MRARNLSRRHSVCFQGIVPQRPGKTASRANGYRKHVVHITGRVVAVEVEADGDLHIVLGDATSPKPGIVVCEVLAGATWCEISKTVFSWTRTRFHLHIRSTREFNLNETPIIRVIGKAFGT